MRNLKKIFIFFLFVIIPFYLSYSEEKIVYIDIEKIMQNSKAGKSIKNQLDKMAKDNLSKFKKMEKELKDEENKIISKKNVLSKEEFEKQINDLREKAKKYRNTRNKNVNDLTNKRIEATAKILAKLNPILAKYSEKNGISLIIQKKNIIIGKSELDITDEILKIVNSEIKSISLK
mgnify:FL=1